jgi:hypothetical protein
VEIIPIWGLPKKPYVKLPNSACGEFLISIYISFLFDEIYSEVLEQFKQSALMLSDPAKKSCSKNGLPY